MKFVEEFTTDYSEEFFTTDTTDYTEEHREHKVCGGVHHRLLRGIFYHRYHRWTQRNTENMKFVEEFTTDYSEEHRGIFYHRYHR